MAVLTYSTKFNGKNNAASSLIVSGTIAASLPGSYLVAFINIVGAGVTVTSVTWNGVALAALMGSSQNNTRGEAWTLALPDSGAHDLVVTLSGSAAIEAGAVVVKYADLAAPVYASQFTQGTTTGPHSNIATLTSGMVISGLAAAEVGGGTQSAVIDGTSTERWNEKTTGGGVGDVLGGSGTKPGDGTSTGPAWTLNNSADWVVCAVSMKPAPTVNPPAGTAPVFPRSTGVRPKTIDLAGQSYAGSDALRALDYRLRRFGA